MGRRSYSGNVPAAVAAVFSVFLLAGAVLLPGCNNDYKPNLGHILESSPAYYLVDSMAGRVVFEVASSDPWEVTVEENTGTGNWFTLSQWSGEGNGAFTVDIERNIFDEREVKLRVSNGYIYDFVYIFQSIGRTKEYRTVSQIRAYESVGIINEPRFMIANLITDVGESGKNYTGENRLVFSDKEAGIVICFREGTTLENLDLGAEYEFALLDYRLMRENNGVLFIDDYNPSDAVYNGKRDTLAPRQITAADLVNNGYESMYVSVADVQATAEAAGKPLGDSGNDTRREFISADSYRFAVFTTRYAEFIHEIVPSESGSVSGIVGRFDEENYYIMPRRYSDLDGLDQPTFIPGLRFAAPQFGGPTQFVTGTPVSFDIVLGYFGAAGGENYSVSVEVSGEGAEGFTPVVGHSITLTAGDGTVRIPMAAAPVSEGEVVFTVSGIDKLTNNTLQSRVAAR